MKCFKHGRHTCCFCIANTVAAQRVKPFGPALAIARRLQKPRKRK